MTDPSEYPEDYRELVTRRLIEQYGDRISIRSTIVFPPVEEIEVIEGEKVVSFKGKVRFHVVDRKDKDFGFHQVVYVIGNGKVFLKNEKEKP